MSVQLLGKNNDPVLSIGLSTSKASYVTTSADRLFYYGKLSRVPAQVIQFPLTKIDKNEDPLVRKGL